MATEEIDRILNSGEKIGGGYTIVVYGFTERTKHIRVTREQMEQIRLVLGTEIKEI